MKNSKKGKFLREIDKKFEKVGIFKMNFIQQLNFKIDKSVKNEQNSSYRKLGKK